MKRRAALINNFDRLKKEFPREFKHIDINGVEVYIDVQERKERRLIVEILREYKKHMVIVATVILQNKYNKDFYGKEPHGTLAIKFKNKRTNPRIYCLEFKEPNCNKKVVMVKGVWNKQDMQLDKEAKEMLKAIKEYNYEFYKDPKDAITHRKK